MRKKKQEIKFSEQRVVDKTIDQLDHMILSVNKIKDKNKHGYVQQYFSCDNVILMLNKLNEFIKEQ